MNKNSQRQYQQGIFDPEEATMQETTPVTRLGMNFENDEVIKPFKLLQKGRLKKSAINGQEPHRACTGSKRFRATASQHGSTRGRGGEYVTGSEFTAVLRLDYVKS